jgi:hypothetical protein
MSHLEPKPTVDKQASTGPDLANLKASSQIGAEAKAPAGGRTGGEDHHPKGRWMPVALGSAVLLTLVTVAGIVLITRPASTVDQLLILTVPSGADVTFDSQLLGHSPVKLEGVRMGTHMVSVTKDGFQTIDQPVSVSEATTLDFKLKPLPPKDEADLPKDEAIKDYQRRAEEAFARGDYAIPYAGRSALYFADMILADDDTNAAGLEMRERVRNALLQSAQAATARGDLGQANEVLTALVEYYPTDDAARAAAARLESQLASHRGDIRDLVHKAEDALNAGRLIDPPTASAYYFSKQVLALDRQNTQAKAVRNQIRDKLANSINAAANRGDLDDASGQLDRALRLFPDDKQLGSLSRYIEDSRQQAVAKLNDPTFRRNRGLDSYQAGFFQQAIPDLEFASDHDHEDVAVLFALGRSYYKIHQLDKAIDRLRLVPERTGETYRSALGVLGDIDADRGEINDALEHYTQARALGGSTLYGLDELDNKIDRLNKKVHVKAAEPSAMSIQVKHLHGGLLHGSCSGVLTVDRTGVRFDGPDTFSASIMGTEIAVKNDEITIKFLGKPEKFKALRPDVAEKFREAHLKFQVYNP